MEAEEPYFSQVGSMKEMRALRVHRGMKSYSKLIRNSGGVTFRCRGTCCVTPWVQDCLWNRDGHDCFACAQ